MMTEPGRYDRYPGARPFLDTATDRWLFHGRDREIDDLFYQVLSADLLVLFGKSGLGKSSLLQAGVFPRLRERDLLPLPVRLNRVELPPLELFTTAIEDACRTAGIDYTPGEAGSLWEFFKTAVFWRGETVQTPVLVLDQFEEIFTLQSPDNRRWLARELGELVGVGLPQGLRTRLQAGEELPYSEKPPAVKVILSLREEYLGALQELAAEIPPILEKRFRLTAMNREQARLAVEEPARLTREGLVVATRPFRYEADAVAEMLAVLGGKTGEIEPFQLQVLCREIEQRVAQAQAKGQNDVVVGREFVGGRARMEAILKGLYEDAVRQFPSRKKRKRVRELCERGLLISGSRCMLPEKKIGDDYMVGTDDLQALVENRLLRKEERSGLPYYELSHDSLIKPILKSRQDRRERRLRWGTGVILAVVSCILGIGGYQSLQHRAMEAGARLQEQAAACEDEGDRLKGEGNSGAATAKYQETLKILRESISQSPNDTVFQDQLALDFQRIGEKLAASGDGAGALAAYEKSAGICEDLAGRQPDVPSWLLGTIDGFVRIGDARLENGDFGGAESAYQQYLKIYQKLAERDPTNTKWRRQLGISYNLVGIGRMVKGDLEGAKEAYQRFHEISSVLAAKDPNNTEWQRDLGISYICIGNLRKKNHKFSEAEEAYERGLGIFRELTKQDPNNTDWQRDLVTSYGRIGDLQREKGVPDAALEAYRQAHEISSMLAEKTPNNTELQWDLRASYNRIGDLLQEGGDPERAVEAYREALKVASKVALKGTTRFSRLGPEDTLPKQNLGESYKIIGDALKKRGDPQGAKEAYRQALEILSEVAGEYPDTPQWQDAMEETCRNLGDVLMGSGDLKGAEEAYQKALNITSELAAKYPDNPQRQDAMAQSYRNIGQVRKETGNFEGAEEAYQKALKITSELAVKYPNNNGWYWNLAETYDYLGQAREARNDLEGAEDSYREALKISAEQASKEPGSAEWQWELGKILSRIGDVRKAKEAEDAYQQSLKVFSKLTTRGPRKTQWQADMGQIYVNLGDVRRERRNLKGAEEAYRQALSIFSELASKDPNNTEWRRELGMSYRKIGDIRKARGDLKGALDAFDKALTNLE